MGTNYYLHEKPPCECCGRPFERKHIGKSSAGWTFSLHVIPEEGIHDLADWMRLWDEPGAEIVNEYGHLVSRYDMLQRIALRAVPKRTDEHARGPDRSFDYMSNSAEPGPNGLIRSRIDGRHCIGHGSGTWDLMAGEYS